MPIGGNGKKAMNTMLKTRMALKTFVMIGLFGLLGASLGACGYVDRYEEQVSGLEPTYCYRSIGAVRCYKEPKHREAKRLVNYFGPHPSRYDKPAPPKPRFAYQAPPPVAFYVRDPEPVPEAAPLSAHLSAHLRRPAVGEQVAIKIAPIAASIATPIATPKAAPNAVVTTDNEEDPPITGP